MTKLTKEQDQERLMGRQRGPVELLCNEVGFRFRPQMETVQMLAAFADVLLDVIDGMRSMEVAISRLTGKTPSLASGEALTLAKAMLRNTDRTKIIEDAASVHDFCSRNNPEEADRIIDMVSSCASIVRFGLEVPCHSRHAASAAELVWRTRYGVSLFDQYTGNWCKDWTCAMIEKALIQQIPNPEPTTCPG